METQFLGEHLIPGQLGNFFVVLSFVAALFSTFAYSRAVKDTLESDSWKSLARWAFRIHSLSVVGIIGTLFYMLMNQYFEYHYIWFHSNSEMPMRYVMSSFWEGQEGSFLLWTFWHVVLGNILMKTAKNWEAPVMTVFSSVQAFLASMVLGIHILDIKLGSNPFTILLREHPDFMHLPLFDPDSPQFSPDYLNKIDGRGLNPLLQNYWMTIHPPTLFLGFASTLIPFAYAIAGLWTKRYSEWLRPALPWSFFGVMVLGTGILMGGAWAYEALSFGGFWAWDPVENASLVPWLTFVGAAHLMLIHRNKGTTLVWVFILSIITFLLILYSTFLTRSGVLGESSVHAFTDLGMSGQLLIYLLSYVAISAILLIRNLKTIPKNATEESVLSREFWMFVGALVLFLSAMQIIIYTSIPVINKIFGTQMAPPSDPIHAYHRWQIPLAIIISMILAVGQFLRYKKTDSNVLIKKLSTSLVIAVVTTILVSLSLSMSNAFYIALLFSTSFALFANLDYMIRMVKGQIAKAGASVAHIGFAMILLGALISTANSDVVSFNTSGSDISHLQDINNREHIYLKQNDTLPMGDYHIAYRGRYQEGVNIFFQVDYLDSVPGKGFEQIFTLYPQVQVNPRMGNVAEPDTRHFITKDLYTHVSYALLGVDTVVKNVLDTVQHQVLIGDTIHLHRGALILDSITTVDKQKYGLGPNDIAAQAHLTAIDLERKKNYTTTPVFVIRDFRPATIVDDIAEMGLRVSFDYINPDTELASFSVMIGDRLPEDFIIMKAISFPYINVLWLGCILLIIGTVLAIRSRIKQSRAS